VYVYVYVYVCVLSGQTLSQIQQTSATTTTSSSPSSSTLPTASASTGVDASAPTTSIQIRLSNGQRLVAQFNVTQSVGDVYEFVRAYVQERERDEQAQQAVEQEQMTSWELQSNRRPNKQLTGRYQHKQEVEENHCRFLTFFELPISFTVVLTDYSNARALCRTGWLLPVSV
jgi:hypothetical protein